MLSFEQDKNSGLSEQIYTLRRDLHETKEKLAELQHLECSVEGMKQAQAYYHAIVEELKSSQMIVATLEHQLRNARQQFRAAQAEQGDLEREADELRHHVSVQSEHDQQVHILYFFFFIYIFSFFFLGGG